MTSGRESCRESGVKGAGEREAKGARGKLKVGVLKANGHPQLGKEALVDGFLCREQTLEKSILLAGGKPLPRCEFPRRTHVSGDARVDLSGKVLEVDSDSKGVSGPGHRCCRYASGVGEAASGLRRPGRDAGFGIMKKRDGREAQLLQCSMRTGTSCEELLTPACGSEV